MNPRFFCPDDLFAGASFALPAAVAHHALRVLRLQPGDPIVLFNGRGGEYHGRIASAGRETLVDIDAFVAIERESSLKVTLVQALASGDKMDWIVEKAVELGVSAIIPVIAERSVVRLAGERAEKRVAHLRAVACAACEQCGRNRIPAVEPVEPLGHFLARSRELPGLRLVLSPGGSRQLAALQLPAEGVTLLVGPEGGWSGDELAAIRSAGWGDLTLGPRVLRTETAGPAVLAALQGRWGDF